MAKLAGKLGYVQTAGPPLVSYAFTSWKGKIHSDLEPVTGFLSLGFRELVSCINSLDFTIEGPYDAGNFNLLMNTVYNFILGYTFAIGAIPNLGIVTPSFISDIEPTVDSTKAQRVSLSCMSTGPFNVTTLPAATPGIV